MTNHNQIIGKKGEESAITYLLENGFSIIEQNYRYKKLGEIDIIAHKGNTLVFVEVKTRENDSFGGPKYSITRKKKHTLRRVAEQFLIANPRFYTKKTICRFDLLAIDNGKIEWVQDIIR